MAIANSAITTNAAAVYTSSGNNAITTVIVCNKVVFDPVNPLTGQTTLFLWAVPAADVPGGVLDKHLIVNGLPIPAGETVTFDQEKMVLASGDSLFAKSTSPANLVVTVSTLAV